MERGDQGGLIVLLFIHVEREELLLGWDLGELMLPQVMAKGCSVRHVSKLTLTTTATILATVSPPPSCPILTTLSTK